MLNRLTSCLIALLVLAACANQQSAEAQPQEEDQEAAMSADSDEAKMFMAIGALTGQQFAPFELTADELDHVVEGLRASVLGEDLGFNPQEFMGQIQTMAQERQKVRADKEAAEGAAYLEKMGQEDGAEVTESGLIYRVLSEGTGPSPVATDKVKVHYHGTFRDGKVFDSSVDKGAPVDFPLNGVIKCWTEGVQKMKVGGKSRLICPPEIAYGAQGRPSIPPNSVLVFEVELLEILAEESAEEGAG